jgi:hypothetical protein
MPRAIRDARPWLQIVHVADLDLVDASVWRDPSVPFAAHRHDPAALPRFTDFVTRITHADPVWRRAATWFVACGGRTAVGDASSHRLADTWLRRWSSIVSASGFLALDGECDRKDPSLRDPVRWPAPPLRERTPNGRIELQLFAHDGDDSDAASRLARIVSASEPEPPRLAFRVMAAHAGVSPARVGMHVTLASSRATPRPDRDTLTVDTLAAHAGTQSCRVHRLYWSPSHARTVVLERWTAVRQNRLGAYAFSPTEDSNELADERVFEL